MADDVGLLFIAVREARAIEEVPRVPRVFRDRLNPLEVFRPAQVRKKFRFWPHQILEILDEIRDDIEPDTQRSHAIPALTKLCATLRFFACGTYLDVVGDVMGLSDATVCRIVHDVTRALLRRRRHHLTWPANESLAEIKSSFMDIAGKSF